MLKKAEAERMEMTKVLRQLQISGPEARYDIEYSTALELSELTQVACCFEDTHYWFWSPVLEENFLRSIIGPSKNILDVGAGNGALLKRIVELGVDPSKLTGVDISCRAVDRIKEIGARAVHGSIFSVPALPYDVVFLSYFVDRDRDQRGTFEETARITRPGGLVVLEGLFPCVLSDSSGVQYGTANVTKGQCAGEDIELVVGEFAKLGVVLKSLTRTQRFVYSLDGPEVLSSDILVFSKS